MQFSLSHATLLKYVSVNTKKTVVVSYDIHSAIITAPSAEVFDVGVPDIALYCTFRQKLPPDFIQIRNKLMIYKLREEKIRKASQQTVETSILTNICNHK